MLVEQQSGIRRPELFSFFLALSRSSSYSHQTTVQRKLDWRTRYCKHWFTGKNLTYLSLFPSDSTFQFPFLTHVNMNPTSMMDFNILKCVFFFSLLSFMLQLGCAFVDLCDAVNSDRQSLFPTSLSEDSEALNTQLSGSSVFSSAHQMLSTNIVRPFSINVPANKLAPGEEDESTVWTQLYQHFVYT